jgi:hypothetical protein
MGWFAFGKMMLEINDRKYCLDPSRWMDGGEGSREKEWIGRA